MLFQIHTCHIRVHYFNVVQITQHTFVFKMFKCHVKYVCTWYIIAHISQDKMGLHEYAIFIQHFKNIFVYM